MTDNVTPQSPSNLPRVDIVLQATGHHSWNLARGWENAATSLGVLHRTFVPRSEWGDADAASDDGLYAYLDRPGADMMLLLGFDWHSQMLHMPKRWQDRWHSSDILKVVYVHESIEDNCRLWENTLMKTAIASAARMSDLIVYNDLADSDFLETLGTPSRWQPYGVDPLVFKRSRNFDDRRTNPFFRGKTTPYYTQNSYRRRRNLMEQLEDHGGVDLLPYQVFDGHQMAEDLNSYQVALNLPTLGHNFPSRVTEAMACGCALITNRTGLTKNDGLFEDGRHLLYYDNGQELLDAVDRLAREPALKRRMAEEGYRETMERFKLSDHLRRIFDWATEIV